MTVANITEEVKKDLDNLISKSIKETIVLDTKNFLIGRHFNRICQEELREVVKAHMGDDLKAEIKKHMEYLINNEEILSKLIENFLLGYKYDYYDHDDYGKPMEALLTEILEEQKDKIKDALLKRIKEA